MSLVELVEHSRKLRPRTKASYLYSVQTFENYLNGKPATAAALERWRDRLEKSGLKPQSINTMLSGVRWASAKRHARDPALVDFAAAVDLLPVEADESNATVLTAAQCKQLLRSCEPTAVGLRDRALLELGLRTGMRREGLCSLVWADLAREASGNYAKLTYTAKGGRRVIIRIGKPVVWLEAWGRVIGTEGRIFRSIVKPRLDDRVIVRDKLTPGGLYKALGQRAEALGIPFHPHAMRHTFVTLAHAAGVPDWRVAAVTGHKMRGAIDNYTHDLDGVPVGDLLPF